MNDIATAHLLNFTPQSIYEAFFHCNFIHQQRAANGHYGLSADHV